MEAIKTSVTNSPAESEVKGKAVKKSGKRIGYNYIILKSLKESKKNDVVKCLYIKSLTNFGICVIKEGTYGDTRDKQGRDIKDRLIWQRELHEQLQGKVRLPRLLGSFEENGNYYLVLERIKGKSLYKACKDAGKGLREGLITGNKLGMKFLGYMIQMIELLETLHKLGIVHRDVTATNFMITPRGKVAVIDMELSYSLGQQFPNPPFQLGTYGYMSPEQERTEMPGVEQDVYSMGAILLYMWTGILPDKLTGCSLEDLENKIMFFIPDKEIANILLHAFYPLSHNRPSLCDIRRVIENYMDNIKKRIKRNTTVVKTFSRNEILDTIRNVIGTYSTSLLADEEKGWFSEEAEVAPNPDKKKINKAWYSSFSKGNSGVIYMLSKANLVGIDVTMTRFYIEKGLELIEKKYISRIQKVNGSLYYGSSGIAATLATSILDGLIEPQDKFFEWIVRLLEIENSAFGIQNGIAGQGLANWLCLPFLQSEKVQLRTREYIDQLLTTQRKDGSWERAAKNRSSKVTRGFANGMAGIIYFLLEFYNRNKYKESLEGAEKGLHWLQTKAVWSKDNVSWRSSRNKRVLPWWADGAPGIALTYLKAWSILDESIYKEYAMRALRTHDRQVIDPNLGQRHGLAGLGEIYLEAWRVLKSDEWYERATWLTQVLMHMKKQDSSYGPYWIVENERQPVSDFMSGNSGVVHYLLRYCNPHKIGFPMLP